MAFLYLKALHIIFIVTWFAGLFYVVRLFIYQTEANQKPEPDRSILIKEYQRNTKRLWFGITWPSAILTLVFGIWVLTYVPEYLEKLFMQLKLVFVLLLYCYHFICHKIYSRLQRNTYKYSGQSLRIWNEVATILLVGIVFIIVLKSAMSMIWAFLGLLIFTLILLLAIKIYKKIRQSDETKK